MNKRWIEDAFRCVRLRCDFEMRYALEYATRVVMSMSIVPDDVRDKGSHDDRPKKMRLTATQTPHKWDWVSAAILGNPLSFSLHPPSFITTLLLATLLLAIHLLATPDRLTSAWIRHPPVGNGDWGNSRILRRVRRIRLNFLDLYSIIKWTLLNSLLILKSLAEKVRERERERERERQKLAKNCKIQVDVKKF